MGAAFSCPRLYYLHPPVRYFIYILYFYVEPDLAEVCEVHACCASPRHPRSSLEPVAAQILAH